MADRFLQPDPPPLTDAVVDRGGRLTNAWRRWFDRLPSTLSASIVRLNSVQLSNQTDSIAATNFANYSILPGLYRVTYYIRYGAAGGESTLSVTINWLDGNEEQTFQGADMTGGSTTTWKSETFMARADKGSYFHYSTTFTAAGEPPTYNLDLVLEKMKTT